MRELCKSIKIISKRDYSSPKLLKTQTTIALMSIEVGDRRSYNGELCTVRFVGEVPAWPGEVALGVEWDDPSKGKHNGSYKGVKYFETTHENSGSFLKKSKKHDGVVSFYKALIETYATKVENREITIGSKTTETLGFEKLQTIQSDLANLKTVALSRKQINGIEKNDIDYSIHSLVNLTVLDLSFNLLSNLQSVIEITNALPNLKKLNLTGNRFTDGKPIIHSSIQVLNLTFTNISSTLLGHLPESFPSLTELYLADINLETFFTPSFEKLTKLKSLDLSMNKLTHIPEGIAASSVTSLNLSNNLIYIKSSTQTFPTIETLDIRRNQISSWEEIDHLNNQFLNVLNLRINGNPLFDELSVEEADFGIIARWPNLEYLNGVKISENDRINSELYFISQINSNRVTSYNSLKLNKLLLKHGKHLNISRYNQDNINSKLKTLTFLYNKEHIKLDVLEDVEILRLRGILSRIIKKSVIDFKVTYEIGNLKESLNSDLSLISSYSFEDSQVLKIEDV